MKKGKRTYKEVSKELETLTISKKSPTPSKKRGKKPAKKSTKPATFPEEIPEIAPLDLFSKLSSTNFKPNSVISALEAQLPENLPLLLREFLNFLLSALGLDDLRVFFAEKDALKLSDADFLPQIRSFFETFEANEEFSPPWQQKSKGNLAKNLEKLAHSLFFDAEGLVFANPLLLQTLANWLSTFSRSSSRLLRACSLEILQVFLRKALEFAETLEKSAQRTENLGKTSDDGQKLRFLEDFVDEAAKVALFRRTVDVRPEVRAKALGFVAGLALRRPQMFANREFFEVLRGSLLRTDELEATKVEVLAGILRILEKIREFPAETREFSAQLRDFLCEMREKLMDFAFCGGNKLQVATLRVLFEAETQFSKLLSTKDRLQLLKLALEGGRDAREMLISRVFHEIFEANAGSKRTPAEKLCDLVEFCVQNAGSAQKPLENAAISEENARVSKEFAAIASKIQVFVHEARKNLKEKCQIADFVKALLDFSKRNDPFVRILMVFSRNYLTELAQDAESADFQAFSVEIVQNLAIFSDFSQQNSQFFCELLRLLRESDAEVLANPENFAKIESFFRTLRKVLDFFANDAELFQETCVFLDFLAKASKNLKTLAADTVNSLVNAEIESFQEFFAQIYANLLDLDLLATKAELFEGISGSLQRFIEILKHFHVPALVEDEFLLGEVALGLEKHLERVGKNNAEDEKLAESFLVLLGLGHYWLLTGLFHNPDEMTVYSQYFRVRARYYGILQRLLRENFPPNFREKACEQAISLISLLSVDELHKLQGIYLSPSDELCDLVANFLENSVETPAKALKTLAQSLFSGVFRHERLVLSRFGPRILKIFARLRDKPWQEPAVSLLKSLKIREFSAKNRESLVFWKCVQDFLFEICEDNAFSNTEQLEIGQNFCKIAKKCYFSGEKSEKNPAFLKKYLLFLADSVVRAFEKDANLLIFELFEEMLHKPAFDAAGLEKLLSFVRSEAERRAESLENVGKKLEKTENFRAVQGFLGSLEKMREKKAKLAKKAKENEGVAENSEEKPRKRKEKSKEKESQQGNSKGKRKMF